MLSRTKICLAFALLIYLMAITAVATALYYHEDEKDGAPSVRQVSVSRNAFGRLGLKLEGANLTADTRLMLMADTLDSDIRRAHSLDRGHMFDLEVSGDYLWVARSGGGIESFLRYHEPLLAVESHLDLTARIVDIEIVGSYLYALSSKPARLYKISIADPRKPRQVGAAELGGKPVSLWSDGVSLVVADHARGLWQLSLDLEISVTPERHAELDSAWRVAGDESELFVIAHSGKLWRLQRTRGEEQLQLLRDFGETLRGIAGDGHALHIHFDDGTLRTFSVDGSQLRLLQEISSAQKSVAGLHLEKGGRLLVALSPAEGAIVYQRDGKGLLETVGKVMQTGQFTSAVAVGNRLYTTATRGVSSWDLDALAAPRIISPIRTYSGTIYNLFGTEGKLIASSENFNLQVFDIDDLGQTPQHYTQWEFKGLSVAKGHVWLGRKGAPVTAFHVERNGELSPCSELPDLMDRHVLSSNAQHLAVAGEKGVELYSLVDPCHPKFETTLPMSGRIADVLFKHEFVYVASDTAREIAVYRLDEKGGAKRLGGYVLPKPLYDICYPRNLVLHEETLYVSLGRVGLLALDVSKPAEIRQNFCLDTPGFSGQLHVQDGILYLSDRFAGIWMLDLELTKATRIPRVIGSISTAPDPQDIYFHGGRLLLAGGPRGLVVMDEPERLKPEYANGEDAFYPLPVNYQKGRFRMLVYNSAGRMADDRVVGIQP